MTRFGVQTTLTPTFRTSTVSTEQSRESTNVVATWIRDEKLETLIPNEPKITSGQVVVHSDRVMIA
jgi:hypothetical protein